MHEGMGMGLDRINALGRLRSRIKLGNILVEEHLNGPLATPLSKITHAQCIVRAQIAPESST